MRRLPLFILTNIVFFTIFSSSVIAENLASPNYELIDAEIGSSAGETDSAQYKQLLLLSNGINYSQVSSALYKIGNGQGYTFMANTPKVQCFETITDGVSTLCQTIDSTQGMVGICGIGGCSQSARFEIDTQANPSDTLYAIEITTDNFVHSYILDGTTHTLKDQSSRSINDYKTKTAWESSPWNKENIIGLTSGVQYTMRISALQGNFTESSYSPTAQATTGITSASLDIDIASNFTDENDAPYTISLGNLIPETPVFADKYIKVDFSSNSNNGVELYVSDLYSGLRSNNTSELLQSDTEDLSDSSSNDGYGIRVAASNQDTHSFGKVSVSAPYNTSSPWVGKVQSTTNSLIACSLVNANDSCTSGTHTWISNGSVLITVGGRSTFSTKAARDFRDQLVFTLLVP